MPTGMPSKRYRALAAQQKISDTLWPFQRPTKSPPQSPPQQIVVVKQSSQEVNLKRQSCLKKFGAKLSPPAAKEMIKQESLPEKTAEVQSIPVEPLVTSRQPSRIFQGPEDTQQKRLTHLAKAMSELKDDCVMSDDDLQLLMASKYGVFALLEGESIEIEETCNSETSTWKAVLKDGRNFNKGKVCKSNDRFRFSQTNSYSILDRKQMEDIEAKRRQKSKIAQLKEWEDRSYKMTVEELIERDHRYGHRQPGATFTVKGPGNWLKNN